MSSIAAKHKTQIRFNGKTDLDLLKEVISKNPFRDRRMWEDISNNFSADVEARRCRERTNLLLEHFKRDDAAALRRSGTEEECDEKQQLLQEVSELADEEAANHEEQTTKRLTEERRARRIRKRAMEGMARSSTGSGSEEESDRKWKSTKKSNIIDYLVTKSTEERQLREEELQLSKSRLELYKERFELENQERLQRLQKEKE